MADDTRTVLTTIPLEIGGTKHPAGSALLLSAADAQVLIEQGRATEAAPAQPSPAPPAAAATLAASLPPAPPAAPTFA